MRHDKRNKADLRVIQIESNYLNYPEGSVLVSFGQTKVIITATIEESVPPFLKGSGIGWLTAEYCLLPKRVTHPKNRRESNKRKLTGRTMKIQRLIGRALRAVVDFNKLGERSIVIDCDVIKAEGGTRTASITGAFVAMQIAIDKLIMNGEIAKNPIKEHLAAISVGILPDRSCVVDLDYSEESSALVEMTIVMTESGHLVEIQGAGEEATFSKKELNTLIDLGEQGIKELIKIQKACLKTQSRIKEKQQTKKKELVIATKNAGKAQEFEAMFKELGYTIKTLIDYPEIPEVEETGVTFEENARLKAQTIAKQLDTLVLADDSGLMVDALDGQPGVYSARFAGEDKNDAANNAKLLAEMHDVTKEKRGAKFHCTLVLASPTKESLVVKGELAGEIASIPRGENGFGYDSLFFVPEYNQTLAQLTANQKNKISHRKKALAQMLKQLKPWMEDV